MCAQRTRRVMGERVVDGNAGGWEAGTTGAASRGAPDAINGAPTGIGPASERGSHRADDFAAGLGISQRGMVGDKRNAKLAGSLTQLKPAKAMPMLAR